MQAKPFCRWLTRLWILAPVLLLTFGMLPEAAGSTDAGISTGTRPFIYGCGIMYPYWRNIPPEKHDAWTVKCLDLIKEMGGTAVTADITWIGSESVRGKYDWAKVDDQVRLMRERGLEPFAYTGLTPDWALPPEAPKNSPGIGYRFPPAEEYIPDFERWCEAVAARYRGKIKYYEFWNEPNGCSWINDGCSNGHMGASYVPWLKRWYTAMKKGDPDCVLSVGGLDYGGHGNWALRFLEDIYANGGKGFFDAVTIHPYGEPLHWQALAATHQCMVKNGDGDKKIWIGEWGYGTTDEPAKARQIIDVLNRLKQPEFHYVFYANYLGLTDVDEDTHDFGLCDSVPSQLFIAPRASYLAYKNIDKTFPAHSDQAPDNARSILLPGGTSMEFVRVPAGTFTMGTSADEADRETDESQHKARLTPEVWMGKYEVTNKQYRLFQPEHVSGAKADDPTNADDHPVTQVTWEDAAAFCRWASERTGKAFRLPTESEWEYACRAGTDTPYGFGDSNYELQYYAWYKENSEGHAHPVGQLRPNSWGLHDMHGNVAEWCADWFGDYPGWETIDPQGPPSGEKRNLRGGSWSSAHPSCRSGDRDAQEPKDKSGSVGFRVVWSSQEKEMKVSLGSGREMEFIRIPAGTFTMGSPKTELDREGDEVQHEVTLTRNFWMGKYEVTNADFRLFRADHISGQDANDERNRDEHPAVNVTWEDANAFCAWMKERTGRDCRLPTEAEREYACRAGTTTQYSFGDDPHELPKYAWYRTIVNGRNRPVGLLRPNPWGLFDMYGNAAEWCSDWYGPYPEGPVTDPQGPDTGSKRVLREGSGASEHNNCRSADRDVSEPEYSGDGLGFRVVFSD